MHPFFKALTTLLIIALIADAAFIAYLQFTGRGFGSVQEAVTEEIPASEEDGEESAAAEENPEEQSTAIASPGEASEEEPDEPQMYEGALAGHTQEEIEAMALAEEESAERLTEDKAESSTD